MPLHRDLLEQAEHLAKRERARPKQASLRRAVSAAYYALFHLLIDEAKSLLIVPEVQNRFSRAFEHGDMKNASKAFVGTPPVKLAALTGGLTIPTALENVASAFLELQEKRHEADYNPAATFTRSSVNDLVALTQDAFREWRTIRKQAVAKIYLSALLLWKKWSR